MLSVVYKSILIAPMLAIFIGALATTIAQTAHADISPGAQAARNDWASGQRDDSCNDHGYNSVNDPGFCISFKIDYDAQWVVLGLAQ